LVHLFLYLIHAQALLQWVCLSCQSVKLILKPFYIPLRIATPENLDESVHGLCELNVLHEFISVALTELVEFIWKTIKCGLRKQAFLFVNFEFFSPFIPLIYNKRERLQIFNIWLPEPSLVLGFENTKIELLVFLDSNTRLELINMLRFKFRQNIEPLLGREKADLFNWMLERLRTPNSINVSFCRCYFVIILLIYRKSRVQLLRLNSTTELWVSGGRSPCASDLGINVVSAKDLSWNRSLIIVCIDFIGELSVMLSWNSKSWLTVSQRSTSRVTIWLMLGCSDSLKDRKVPSGMENWSLHAHSVLGVHVKRWENPIILEHACWAASFYSLSCCASLRIT